MDRAEAEEAKTFIVGLVRRVRMEYGLSMALHGFDDSVIIAIQQDVAKSLVDYLRD